MSESVSFDLGIAEPDVDYRILVRRVVRGSNSGYEASESFGFCLIGLWNVNTFVPETLFVEAFSI